MCTIYLYQESKTHIYITHGLVGTGTHKLCLWGVVLLPFALLSQQINPIMNLSVHIITVSHLLVSLWVLAACRRMNNASDNSFETGPMR